MFDSFHLTIGVWPLAKRVAREFMADDCLGIAAQLAYYFFFSLFPALLALLAVASFFSLAGVSEQLMASLGSVAPRDVLQILNEQIGRISDSDDGGLLTLGFLGAIWGSSSALASLVNALNRAYDIDDARPWWRVRLTAIGLTVALVALLLVSSVLVVAGPWIAENLAERLGLGAAFTWTWNIAQWPAAFALVVFAVGLIYYFGPDAEQQWEWITPGAVVATVLWLLASLALRYYIVNFGNYADTYGAVGGVIVLMLWLYISGLAFLVGAETNAEIEHAALEGKAPGEKKPGEKKKIGRLAIESAG